MKERATFTKLVIGERINGIAAFVWAWRLHNPSPFLR
jgi:hypothetical protein